MTSNSETPVICGDVINVPLNRLKASPRNARRTPHPVEAIEALAASIAVKGVLQAPVVEAETDAAGAATGCYLVTIGEGRRQALLLLARRKVIGKTALVRCVLDGGNDPHEISLDENITRTAMHPADQFEAFRALAERRGLSAEEIGARFGVSGQVVRQRLRLAAVSPKLMELYRAGDLTLDQLTAFAVSEDHARQEQVLDTLSWNRAPHMIRRAMTETHVPAGDRRAVFVGIAAYEAAGGAVLRDLFTEDGGGWLEDVGLLERLAMARLEAMAAEVRDREGWRWAEAHLDYPHGHGLGRVYPGPVARSDADQASMAALTEEYDALAAQWAEVEEAPAKLEARFRALDEALAAFGDTVAYAAEDVARGGVYVVLGHDGQARIERGLIRPEDRVPEPEAETVGGGEGTAGSGPAEAAPAEDEDAGAPLSDRLVADLTAHRTLALRDALAGDPATALAAVTHALVLFAFYPPWERASCLEIRAVSTCLEDHAPGLSETPLGRRIAERHAAWAARLPKAAGDAWAFVAGLGSGEVLDLMAHCASLSLNAVRAPGDRRPDALAQADALAEAVALDMAEHWAPTVASYLGRVTKAGIAQAVAEGVSAEAAARIAGLKKPEMAQAAEQLLAGRRWLPGPLRRAGPAVPEAAAPGQGEPDTASGMAAAA